MKISVWVLIIALQSQIDKQGYVWGCGQTHSDTLSVRVLNGTTSMEGNLAIKNVHALSCEIPISGMYPNNKFAYV